MSSGENDNDGSKAKIMNAPLIVERTIDDWSSNTDKTITHVLYANPEIGGKVLICAWKASPGDDQEYSTNLSPTIYKIENHNSSSKDSEVDVDKSKAKVLNPPFVARTIGDWSSNLSPIDPTQLTYYHNNRTGQTMWEPPLGFEDDREYINYRTSITHLQITTEDSELEVARKKLAIAKEQATAARTYEQSIKQVMDAMHKQLMRPAIDSTLLANNIVKYVERELVQTENRIKGVDGSILQNELWIRSFSYLDESDLFSLGQVSRKFLSISSADELWKPICLRRWKKKQNVKRFMKKGPSWETSGRQQSIAEVVSLTKCMSRRDQPPIELPAFNMRSEGYGVVESISWKQSYIMAHLDSRRKTISREEILHFKWKEINGGRHGEMVTFSEDGTYVSCLWSVSLGVI